jgi:hypothetical protein
MDEKNQRKNQTLTEHAVKVLVARVDVVLKRRNMAESYFGKRALGDDKSIGRLRENRLTIRKAVLLERYIDVCDLEDALPVGDAIAERAASKTSSSTRR